MGERWIKRKGGKKWHLVDAAITAERENHVWCRGRHQTWAGCGFVTGSGPASQSTEERPKREQMCAHCRKSLPSGPSHTEILRAAALRLARATDAIKAHEDDIPLPLPSESEACAAWSSRHATLSREFYEALAAFRELDAQS